MRVVHLVSGDLWAGAEVMAWHLISHLSGEDCHVTTVCLNEGELSSRLVRAGMDVRILDEQQFSLGTIAMRAAAVLRGQHVDVLHSHRYKEHLLASVLAKWHGTALVATVHGMPEPVTSRPLRHALVTRGTFWLLRRRFDAVAAVSSALKQTLVDGHGFSSDAIHIIRNGIAIPMSDRALRRREVCHVGSVGRLVPVKRFMLFLEVAARLRASAPHLKFSILGDGPERAMLLSRAQALGLADCFNLVDPAPDPSAYYRSLDLYLNTSEAEGLPLSILEAMAFGIPVVAAAVGGIPEVVRDGVNGLLVSGGDPAAFAAQCARLLASDALRDAFVVASKTYVSEHSSAGLMARQYVDLYRRVSTRRAPLGPAEQHALSTS